MGRGTMQRWHRSTPAVSSWQELLTLAKTSGSEVRQKTLLCEDCGHRAGAAGTREARPGPAPGELPGSSGHFPISQAPSQLLPSFSHSGLFSTLQYSFKNVSTWFTPYSQVFWFGVKGIGINEQAADD